MELNVQKSHIQGSEAIQSFGFTIKADAKAFDLLISKLYKDRLAAFIRELSTNAYEAHQMLGIENEQFEITLPTMLTQSFKIRDFGPGLSIEQVGKVYTTIFESTKTGSNDMGGCFGLGSKSPFAYADNFGVISYHGGMKYCYSVFRNEEGFPMMNLLHQEQSNERTGIEVSIPVSRNDFTTVENKAREIYKWFIVPPKCVNGRPFERCNPETKGSNFGHYAPTHISRASARMGNIVYTIDSGLCNLHNLERYPIVVEFPIGALTPEPSREGLSFDKKTKRAIEESFATIKKEFIDKIQPKIDIAIDYSDAVITARELVRNSPVMLSELKWKGQVLNESLGYLNHDIGDAKHIVGDKLKKVSSNHISINQNACYFVLDKKCAYQQIIKFFALSNGLGNNRMYICDEVYNTHERQKFINFFKIDPSKLVLVSSIPYVAPARQVSTKTNRHVTKMFEWKEHETNAYSWKDVELDVKTEKGMYVVYYNNKILVGDREVTPSKLKNLINLIKYKGVVYGVKKDTVDKIAKTGNWTNFLDYAKPIAYHVMKSASVEDAEIAAKIIQDFQYSRTTSHNFIAAAAKMSNFTINHNDVSLAMAEYVKIHTLAKMDYRTMGQVAQEFYNESLSNIGSTKSLDRTKYGRLLKILDNKFPLLAQVKTYDDSVVKELASYISLKGI